jgi:Family of unknown function (DUF5681)
MNEVTKTPKTNLWKPGVSGNPAGRPKGSKNAISLIKLQVEGELRAQMKPDMQAVISEMMRQALPATLPDGKIRPGDRDMLKTLAKMWVSGTVASDEDAPRGKIQILIGKLAEAPAVQGKTLVLNTTDEE